MHVLFEARLGRDAGGEWERDGGRGEVIWFIYAAEVYIRVCVCAYVCIYTVW